ncbi:hypothetical protein NQ176_g5559 [Zarea fungicola]|uniref:Uncharacterized protein n=1 Tax=Zarea fungicola TaxID=93591 RepID=A0ACC1N9T1_9HYPO|nr:hypothetical protein NQ176_g5559 [Lecanicillium fungicola]
MKLSILSMMASTIGSSIAAGTITSFDSGNSTTSFGSTNLQQIMRPIELTVDLVDAPRRLAHVTADMPVLPNSRASFTTPLWIYESHMPDGPVRNIAGLFFTASSNQTLRWYRDPTELYVYHVDVPANVSTVRVSFEAVLEIQMTRRMMMLVWESVLIHPAHVPVAAIPVQPTLRIPRGWNYSTALQLDKEESKMDGATAATTITFTSTSLERLEDSPVLIGRHLIQNMITQDGKHQLCVAFSDANLTSIPQNILNNFENLIREAASVFGPPPYQKYKWLSVSSDLLVSVEQGGRGGGNEHAESCHIFTSGGAFANTEALNWFGDIFSHEYVHVWNGKYRRPVGHNPRDFTTPLDNSLLWVYEGLTKYYGFVLAARSGLSSEAYMRLRLAFAAADMQLQSGRQWRTLEDTARGLANQALPTTAWGNWLGNGAYYEDSVLLWLDADTLIRQQSNGTKTLDDFCRLFFDTKGASQPTAAPYTLDDLLLALNETLPHDWATFFQVRVQSLHPKLNTAGFERAGYSFAYTDKQYDSQSATVAAWMAIWHSTGLSLALDGTLTDVQRHSLPDQAGLAPGQRITHIGGKVFSPEEMITAISLTKGKPGARLQLSVTSGEDSWDVEFNHSTGLLYPTLERKPGNGSDLLAAILTPKAPRQ